jgi:hypothetical protein
MLFEAPDGQIRLDVRLERDTVWLSQNQMAELFGRERSVITKHISNVFNEGELDRDAVCANFAHTAEDGKTYSVCASIVRPDGARQVSRDGECTEAATCKFYLQVRQEAGLGKACLRGAKRGRQVHQLYGDKLNTTIEELNETLAA